MKLILKGGRVINPAEHVDEVADVLIEDGKIAGVPVFQTAHINGIGFGVWGLEPLGQFGDMNFIVDPYTGAGGNITRLVINAGWSMSSLRKEGFCVGKFKTT